MARLSQWAVVVVAGVAVDDGAGVRLAVAGDGIGPEHDDRRRRRQQQRRPPSSGDDFGRPQFVGASLDDDDDADCEDARGPGDDCVDGGCCCCLPGDDFGGGCGAAGDGCGADCDGQGPMGSRRKVDPDQLVSLSHLRWPGRPGHCRQVTISRSSS